MMNISEFERTKPTKTFKIIVGTIAKYERLVASLSPVMDDKDAALLKAYSDTLKDLKEIQKYFLSGE
tara:strand:- start:49 stop:249 length:201 start_codon:yes stop_codon:yes gene_type:complete